MKRLICVFAVAFALTLGFGIDIADEPIGQIPPPFSNSVAVGYLPYPDCYPCVIDLS